MGITWIGEGGKFSAKDGTEDRRKKMPDRFIFSRNQKTGRIKNRGMARGFFLAYLIVLLLLWFKESDIAGTRDIIAYSREGGFWNINLKPFYTIRKVALSDDPWIVWRNLVANVAVFIPIGILYPLALNRKYHFFVYFLHFLLFDFAIEGIQFAAMVGFFDVDDILLNSVGFMCGFVILMLCLRVQKAYRKMEKMVH